MKLKIAFAVISLTAVAACQEGREMPTAPVAIDPEAGSGRLTPAQACVGAPVGTVLIGRQFLGLVVFIGTPGNDVAVGVPGRRNMFLMRGGDDFARGAELQDSFIGDGGNDTWCGGAGNDVAFGGQGSDVLEGEGGVDRNDGGHTPVPSSSVDQDTDTCFGEANFLCEQSSPDGAPL
jgi:hypothetical protein